MPTCHTITVSPCSKSRIDCPGRAACLDAPGHLLMAMDLLEGGDLRSALDEDAEGALRWYRR